MISTRRSVIVAAAWTTPVVLMSAPAQAFAVSAPTIIGYTGAIKCPGNSTLDPKRYVFTFTLDGPPVVGGIKVTTLLINGTVFLVDRIIYGPGNVIKIVSTSSTNSADADGAGSISYTSNLLPKVFTFDYFGTKPDVAFCRTLS